jgi:hypothetical protein
MIEFFDFCVCFSRLSEQPQSKRTEAVRSSISRMAGILFSKTLSGQQLLIIEERMRNHNHCGQIGGHIRVSTK